MSGEAQGNGNNNCFVPQGTKVDSGIAPALPNQFINAWDHVRSVLLGNQPIPNLTWDWNPNVVDVAQPAPTPVDPAPYYPGPSNVDWIGADGYDKLYNGTPLGFSAVFGPFVSEFANYGKPIIVGETGSCQQYPKSPGPDQVEYL
jgi:beta-mannanase